jgi:hypothetical protein
MASEANECVRFGRFRPIEYFDATVGSALVSAE